MGLGSLGYAHHLILCLWADRTYVGLCLLLMVALVVTRWRSASLLAERVAAIAKVNKEALNSIKTSYGWEEIRTLEDDDYALINLFVEFFRPMKELSDILGGEQFLTIQLVLPGVKEIRRQIKKHEDHPVIGALSFQGKNKNFVFRTK